MTEGNVFWGVTLDEENKTEVWDPDVEPYDSDNSQYLYKENHTLIVKQAVLSPNVPDNEVNVIEVESAGYKSDIKCPIVVLKGGTDQSQCLLGISFSKPPIKLNLVKGNGPIHLMGNYFVDIPKSEIDLMSLTTDEEDDDDFILVDDEADDESISINNEDDYDESISINNEDDDDESISINNEDDDESISIINEDDEEIIEIEDEAVQEEIIEEGKKCVRVRNSNVEEKNHKIAANINSNGDKAVKRPNIDSEVDN